jgi:hypothetical protein
MFAVLNPVKHRASLDPLRADVGTDERMRAFLAAIVASSDDSIVATDLDGTILAWNGGSERLWPRWTPKTGHRWTPEKRPTEWLIQDID